MSLIVLLFYFVLIGFSSVYGANDGGCKINDIDDTNWEVKILKIRDDQSKQDIFTSTYDGTLENLACTTDPSTTPDYFEISRNETHFIVATTEEFDNIDLNTKKTDQSFISVTLVCSMTCASGISNLNIAIFTNDTNNHPPTFKSLDEEYKVASPIMPMADFSLYGSSVMAEDIDFSNQHMTFTIYPEDFTITTLASSESKNYTAVFRANKIIQVDGSKEYTLTATDSGIDPGVRNVSQKVTLVPDPSTSLDNPAFQKISYSFTYSEKDGKCTLSPKNGNITLTTNKPDEIAESLALTGDLQDHFKPTFDQTTKTVTISCLTPVSSTSSIAILSLSAETDNVASVPVVLYLTEESDNVPKFNSISYTADYDSTNGKVNLNQDIVVTPNTATVEITDSVVAAYKEYFSLKKESDKYEVVVSKPLPEEILNSQRSIVLIITATLTDVTSQATLVINLPAVVKSSSMEFDSVLYEGSYKVANDGNVDFDVDPIGIVDTETVDRDILVNISESSPYVTYFSASCKNKVVTIEKIKELPEDILKSNSFIALTLEASVSGTESKSSAVLNIIISYNAPEDTSYVNFGNILYEGTYATKNGSIVVNDEINIDTDQVDNIEVTIINEYDKYFTVTYSEKKVTVTLTATDPPEALKSLTFIPIILQGTIKSTSHKSQTVLNLIVIDDTTEDTSYVNFGNVLYEGTYATKNGSIVVNDEINIDTDQVDNIEVTIINEYDKYFTVTYSEKKVTVTLTATDPPEALKSLTFIPIILQGTIKSTSHKSQAVLNLRVIDDSTGDTSYVNFENVLYEGTYMTKDGSIKLSNEINIDSDQVDNIEVSIINEYDKYFTVTYSEKKVTVSLTASNPPEALKSLPFIPLVLQGMIKSTSHKSQTVLTLRVIDDTTGNTSYVNFGNVLYDGTYATKNGSVALNEEIDIITDQVDNIEVSIINEYDKYFTVTYSEKKVTVTLTTSDPPDAFKSLPFIPLILQGTIKSTSHKSQAVLNLIVIDDTTDDTSYVNFENVLYEGTYMTKDGSVTISDEINIDTDQIDNIEVSIVNEYDKYFTVTYSEKKVTVSLTASNPPEAFKSLAFIPLVLQGTIKSTSHKSQAVLNLRVIDDTNGDSSYVNFGNVLYEGTYATKNGSIVLNEEMDIITDQVDNIEVSIINEYDKYFTLTYSQKRVTVSLTASVPPEELKSLAFIPLILQGTIKSTSHKSQAVLNLEVIDDIPGDTSYINFENVLYEGTYVKKDGSITVNDEINIDTDQVDNIEVSIVNEYDKYFTVTYSEKKVTVSLTATNPPEAFKSLAFIPLVLQAIIKSTSHKSQAVLNLRVIDDTNGDVSYVSFGNVLYEGTYATKNGSIVLSEEINIITDQVDNIEVSIINEYDKYFTVTYSEKTVTITVTTSDSPEELKSLSFIPLILQGTIKSTSHKSQAVLNLRVIDDTKEDTSYVNFERVLYEGTYVRNNNSITVSEEIDIDTDQVDNIELSIINEYKNYFTAKYTEKKVTITLSQPLSQELLKSLAFIPIVLQGTIKSTSHKSQAVLNLRIIGGELSLNSSIYNGIYQVEDDKVILSHDQIMVETDQEDDNVDVKIINGYDSDFEVTYSEKEVLVHLLRESPSKVLLSQANIPILIQIQIKDTSIEARAVLNLRVVGDDKNDTKTLSFSKPLYSGNYSIHESESVGHLEIEEPLLKTNLMNKEIEVTISNDYEYDQYFDVTNQNGVVSLKIKGDVLPDKIVKQEKFIPLTVNAKIIDTGYISSAVLNIRIYYSTSYVNFEEILYEGTYVAKNGSITVNNEINLNTDEIDDNVEVVIANNEYTNYFTAKYSEKKVTITLLQPVSQDTLKSLAFIPIVLQGTIRSTSHKSEAVLNLRIIDTANHDDGIQQTSVTGYLVAIVILSILLLGLLVGSIGFYLWRRRSKSYEKMVDDTGSNKVRFEQRNSKQSIDEIKRKGSSALEERRPTGFVYRKFDENGEEIVKDPGVEMVERRKSVAFDDNIEKLQIDPVVDEDIDKALEETEHEDHATNETESKS